MNRLAGVTAAAVAAVVLAPAAGGGGLPVPTTKALGISVVSSPPEYVSGGDARVEVAVPAAHRARRRARDAERRRRDVRLRAGPRGQPPARGRRHRSAARAEHARRDDRRASARPNRVELQLVNHSLDGADVLGAAAAGLPVRDRRERGQRRGLPPIPQSPTCATPTRRQFIYRSTGGAWVPYTPGAPPAGLADRPTTTMDGETVRLRSSAGSAARSTASSTRSRCSRRRRRAGDRRPLRVERRAARQVRGRRRDRPLPGQPAARTTMLLPDRARDGLRDRLLDRHPDERRTTTSSSAARRRSWSRTASSRPTPSRGTRSPSAAPAARSSSTSTGRTIRA